MHTTLDNVTRAHFVGIGGIGLSAIARMFLLRGIPVSGSDLAASRVTEELEKLGARISFGQKESAIPEGTDLVLYTIAIPDDNAELVDAKGRGIQLMTYPEALGLISKTHTTIAISGTHGKTTTTAMTAEALIAAGLDPTVIVGSFLKEAASNFIPGKSDLFVVEACEYKESFAHLEPDILVITNIEADHLDYYRDIDDIVQAFNRVALKVPKEGKVIADTSDPAVSVALRGVNAEILDYKEALGDVKLSIPGEHNRKNAAAALTVARALGSSEEKVKEALENFSGTWRRFERKGETHSGALVYDEYSHHPTEIRAGLSAAREKFPEKRIIAVFQPHLFSRTKLLLNEFASAFGDADSVLILPIYKAREEDPGDISSKHLVEEMKKHHTNTQFVESFDAAIEELKGAGSESVILTLGAGDVYKLGEALVRG